MRFDLFTAIAINVGKDVDATGVSYLVHSPGRHADGE